MAASRCSEESGETNIPVNRRGHEGQIGHITRTYIPSSWTHTLHPDRIVLMPGDKSIFWDYFYTQRPLTLRASCAVRRFFTAVSGRLPTLWGSVITELVELPLYSYLFCRDTRESSSRPRHQITIGSGVHSKTQFDLFYLLETQGAKIY